jgi:hypothetical protein
MAPNGIFYFKNNQRTISVLNLTFVHFVWLWAPPKVLLRRTLVQQPIPRQKNFGIIMATGKSVSPTTASAIPATHEAEIETPERTSNNDC